jgi:hypothetical protein
LPGRRRGPLSRRDACLRCTQHLPVINLGTLRGFRTSGPRGTFNGRLTDWKHRQP